MDKAPICSFTEALEGRIAGVVVSSVDGQPGSANNIVIRGNNFITQDNSPLYIIDGFPIENPDNNAINPDYIESISVLKDASATAIYGARGANGVILITTKSGKTGPPVVNFGASYGLQKTINTVNLMDPYNFVKYQLEVSPGTDTTALGSAAYYYLKNGATLDSYKDSSNINWQSKMFRTAPMQDYNLSITGGSAQTKYAVTGSVLDQDGVIINSGYKRYQGGFALNQNIGKKFKASFNVNYSHLEQSGVNPAATASSATRLGVQAALWTETVRTTKRLEYLLFPRIAALAETAWTNTDNKNYDQFLVRLKKQLLWYKAAGIYYYDPFDPQKTPEAIDK